MAGLGALILVTLWLLLLDYLMRLAYRTAVRRTESKPLGVACSLLALCLVVFFTIGDEYYGKMRLKQLCAKEAGLKVYRTADDAEGIGIIRGSFALDSLEDSKFNFIEEYDRIDISPYKRFSKDGKGGIIKETRFSTGKIKDLEPKSRYFLNYERGLYKSFFPIDFYKKRLYIIDANNQVLSEDVNFYFKGGWCRRLFAALVASSSSGGRCEIPPADIIKETFRFK